MLMSRKSFVKTALITAAALGTLGLAACGGTKSDVGADDMTMGSADAKVTLIEYASVTCTHCAEFNEKVFPTIKANLIDTGKVKYVYREFLTGPADVSAAGVLVARCAGKDKYFSVIDAIMRSQQEIFTTGDGKGVLKRVANSVGMSDDQFAKCVNDPAGVKRINDNMEKYAKEYDITGTPTFFINGEKYEGSLTDAAELEAALKNAKPEAK